MPGGADAKHQGDGQGRLNTQAVCSPLRRPPRTSMPRGPVHSAAVQEDTHDPPGESLVSSLFERCHQDRLGAPLSGGCRGGPAPTCRAPLHSSPKAMAHRLTSRACCPTTALSGLGIRIFFRNPYRVYTKQMTLVLQILQRMLLEAGAVSENPGPTLTWGQESV